MGVMEQWVSVLPSSPIYIPLSHSWTDEEDVQWPSNIWVDEAADEKEGMGGVGWEEGVT